VGEGRRTCARCSPAASSRTGDGGACATVYATRSFTDASDGDGCASSNNVATSTRPPSARANTCDT
jgi:hypothetical protein